MTGDPEWELYATEMLRIKVEGGHIYETDGSICFVPDVDLKRYQSHLRDAYNQGFKDGQQEEKKGFDIRNVNNFCYF